MQEPRAAIELFMVEVRVADWEASGRWYVEVLGLRPVLEDRGRRFLLLEAGSGRLALKEGPASADRGAVRLDFQVGDVDATRGRLLALGSRSARSPRATRGIARPGWLDPEGTPIRLFCWVAKG